MALMNSTLHIVLDRRNGGFEVAADSTRIFTRDEKVTLWVDGWTLEEVTKTEGKTPYEPFFRICGDMGEPLAEAKLEPEDPAVPLEDGTYRMAAELSTNTRQLCGYVAMRGNGETYLGGRVFSTTEPNPIAAGSVVITPFFGVRGFEPKDMPSGSAELAALLLAVNAHIARTDNPHGVNAAQTGAMTRQDCDEAYATIPAVNLLRTVLSEAQTAIQGLTTALAAANAAIQANNTLIRMKADAATTYRKDETYTKGEVDQFVRNLRITPLMGKNFTFKTQNETRAALATVIQLFGGVVNGQWQAVHEAATPAPFIPLAADGHAGTVKLKAVVSDGELTSIVEEA